MQYVRRSDSTTDTFYIPSDHLGGSDAVLNSAGTVLVRTSFDAWGARRDDDWVGAPSSTELQQIADTTRHCYTSHDMLDNVGLVHMNGRVYDPAIGRFMSADPFVVPMLGTQGFNRYAYVGNRPLSYVDPTGFAPKDGDCKDKGPDCEDEDGEDDHHHADNGPGYTCRGCYGSIHVIGNSNASEQGHTGASQTPDRRNVSSQGPVVSTVSGFGSGFVHGGPGNISPYLCDKGGDCGPQPYVTPAAQLLGTAAAAAIVVGGLFLPEALALGTVATRGLAGFTVREAAVIAEARALLSSAELASLRAAHAAGRSASVSIGGRTILYEPGLSASGMTLFGESGFVIGRGAFTSSGEFGRTILHELYRLSHSASAGGVSGALATQETAAAASFAERAAIALGL